MSEHRCHRCGSTLHTETEGALVFCWHCGAPQVTLSEELLEQAEQLRQAQDAREAGASTQARTVAHAPGGVVWKNAIQLSAIVAATMAVITTLFSPWILLWAPLAPGIVLALYASRHRETIFSARMGARVGMACGALIVLGLAVAASLKLAILRFLLHSMGSFDADLAARLPEMRAQMMAAQSDPVAADQVVRWINIPEFRAGMYLASFGFGTFILLVLSAAGGAFAGAMRGRVRAQQSS
ncbi:MAG TPA: hypothetical protein VGN16_23230 [Acidobacteriaceae bacterium]